MNTIEKIYSRGYQAIFKIVKHFKKYREPEILDNILNIKDIIIEKGLKHPLVVTGQTITKLRLYSPLTKELRANNIKVTIFDDVEPNPTIEMCEKAYTTYIEQKCDCIIAFGGGSVIDCAKVAGAKVSNPTKDIEKMKGLLKIKNPLPTFFAVPTTAGTGSEVSVSAVITNPDTHSKFTINDFELVPNYAVLDESLTEQLPKNLVATTGMDALTHAIESYIGKATTPQTEHYALEACRLIFDNLIKVYDDNTNARARKNMLKGSYQAGLAFRESYVGYIHAIAHSLGGKYNTEHGLANAVIMPYVLSEYGSIINNKLARIAVYCNIAKQYDSVQMASNKLINKIIEMNEYFGIPKKFDFIREEDIPILAKTASKEANPLYPVPKLLNAKELEKIYFNIKI